jgi:hypothetical protein
MARLPVSTREVRGSRKGKYNANGRHVDGHWFASNAEAVRYEQLKELAEQGRIENLELQPNYAIRLNNHPITTYRADFRYAVLDERGRVEKLVVEDVKGMITDVYALKKKLFEAAYEIKINEIPASKVEQWRLTIP